MKSFNIFVADDATFAGEGKRRMQVRGDRGERGVKLAEVPTDQLLTNMREFMGNTQELLQQGDDVDGPYQVKTVEITAQISAEGKVGLLGTGLGFQGGAGIKLIFERS